MEPLKSTGAQAAKMQAREETTSLRNPSHPPRVLQWQTIPNGRGGDGAFSDDDGGRWLIRRAGKRARTFSLRRNGALVGHFATIEDAKRRATAAEEGE